MSQTTRKPTSVERIRPIINVAICLILAVTIAGAAWVHTAAAYSFHLQAALCACFALLTLFVAIRRRNRADDAGKLLSALPVVLCVLCAATIVMLALGIIGVIMSGEVIIARYIAVMGVSIAWIILEEAVMRMYR